jgi:hypothetical protein
MAANIYRYYGLNTSLYDTLQPVEVRTLERAIYCTTIGDYATAHSIFSHELSSCANIPVVAIERAELALLQGRYKEIWEVLDGVLAGLAPEDPGLKNAPRRLMRMFHALGAIKYKGTLEPAKREIQRVREWLAHTPVGDYTDVQVSGSGLLPS